MLPFRWLLGVLACLLLDFSPLRFSGLGLDRSIYCLPVPALCDTVVECNVTSFSLENKMFVGTTFLFSFKRSVFRNMIIWLKIEKLWENRPSVDSWKLTFLLLFVCWFRLSVVCY